MVDFFGNVFPHLGITAPPLARMILSVNSILAQGIPLASAKSICKFPCPVCSAIISNETFSIRLSGIFRSTQAKENGSLSVIVSQRIPFLFSRVTGVAIPV